MILMQYPQERCDDEIVKKITALEDTAWKFENREFPSAPDTYMTSFVLLENDIAVCHIGIRKSRLFHKGEEYLAFGLSEVVTHPDYQNQGLASKLIKKVAEYINEQQGDISIFTCERKRVSLYTRGGWKEIKGACFVGGAKEKPFRSDSLNLVTMMKFLSLKGKEHKKDFEDTDIVFELGENQLW